VGVKVVTQSPVVLFQMPNHVGPGHMNSDGLLEQCRDPAVAVTSIVAGGRIGKRSAMDRAQEQGLTERRVGSSARNCGILSGEAST